MIGKTWHVYLARCSDGSLYCGITTDVTRRLNQHNRGCGHEGRGAKCLRGKLPVVLAWSEAAESRSWASVREAEIKKMNHADKLQFLWKWERMMKVLAKNPEGLEVLGNRLDSDDLVD